MLGGGVSGATHVVFALLTIFTCGLFGIIWLIVAATSQKRRADIAADPYGNIIFNGRQSTVVDPPAKGPTQANGVDAVAEGPAAAGPSNKGFLARHQVAIILGAVLLMGGGFVAAIAASNTSSWTSGMSFRFISGRTCEPRSGSGRPCGKTLPPWPIACWSRARAPSRLRIFWGRSSLSSRRTPGSPQRYLVIDGQQRIAPGRLRHIGRPSTLTNIPRRGCSRTRRSARARLPASTDSRRGYCTAAEPPSGSE